MYIVEGIIGAGKSTFLKLVQAHMSSISVVFEPVSAWHNGQKDLSLLDQFYCNPQRWAYTMETFTLACRAAEHIKEQEYSHSVKLQERSVYSGYYCFAYNSYANGFLTDLEWNLYLNWFNLLVVDKCKPPKGFIYLQVDPEVAFTRIHKRQRLGEQVIPLEYLKALHERHEQFLIHKQDISPELKAIPVLIINANREFEHNSQEFYKHMQALESFIET